MANIPNIKIVMNERDPYAKVTNLDTGEPIDNIASIKFDLDANRSPFALVELTCYLDVEYEGPAGINTASVFDEGEK